MTEERDVPGSGLDVAPTTVRPSGRRGRDPLPVVVLVVAVAVAVAAVKPWGDSIIAPVPDATDGRDRSTSDSTQPSAVRAPSASEVLRGPVDPADPWTAVGMLAALGGRSEWGIAVLGDEPGTSSRVPAFSERWQPVVPSPDGVRTVLEFDAGVQAIRALAVTTPTDDVPLAVRAWVALADDRWGWLDARSPTSDRPAADLVLIPPRVAGTPRADWPAGRYRIDLLMGDRVDRLDVRIVGPGEPGQTGRLPDVGAVDAAEEDAQTWLALDGQVAPGTPPDAPSDLLVATRRAAAFAGMDGLVITDARTGSVRSFSAAPSIGCGDAIIGETVPALGITHEPGAGPSSVAIIADGPLGQRVSLRLRSTREVVPGLTIVAPARGATFPDGVYRLVLGGPGGHDTTLLCLGTAPFHG